MNDIVRKMDNVRLANEPWNDDSGMQEEDEFILTCDQCHNLCDDLLTIKIGRAEKDVCSQCHQRMSMKLGQKKKQTQNVNPSLNARNLSSLGGMETNVQFDARSNASSGADSKTSSYGKVKFYCCEEKCRTEKTRRFRSFYTLDNWIIHMMDKHSANLSYDEYVEMPRIKLALSKETRSKKLSKYGDLDDFDI